MKTYIYPHYLILFLHENGFEISGWTSTSFQVSKLGVGVFYITKTTDFFTITQLVEIFYGQKSSLTVMELDKFFSFLSKTFPIASSMELYNEIIHHAKILYPKKGTMRSRDRYLKLSVLLKNHFSK